MTKVYDEMWGLEGDLRAPYRAFNDWFAGEDPKRLRAKQREAEELFRLTGITFNVYGRKEAEEKLIPFDIVPRIISGAEWSRLSRGIEQRVRAINAFLHDIYHSQEIIRAGRVPPEAITRNDAFLPHMIGMTPPGGIYTHITGIDLVCTGEGDPVVAVLTPGIFNSAHFEHAFLADQMGVELVEGHDLRVVDGRVAMRTTCGYKPVDVLYRRVDDEFLDPMNFNPDSQLGVPGIMDVYRAGGITIANAPGTGIADDKAIYSYMPEIVEFYTGERPLLQNVPTWRCSDPDDLAHVLENLGELAVKEVHGSGGYGMLIGPTATKTEIAKFRKKLSARPANYIAQPTLSLSTVPIFSRQGLAPRHVDLRPFVLVSPEGIRVTPGGLTRVALKKGSLVVNSSQGGGTKDTWVLGD